VRRWLGREKEVEGCVNKRRGSARSPSARRWGVEVLVAYFAVRPLASRDFAGAHHCLRPPWAQAVVGEVVQHLTLLKQWALVLSRSKSMNLFKNKINRSWDCWLPSKQCKCWA
jgi:hypothetical protein